MDARREEERDRNHSGPGICARVGLLELLKIPLRPFFFSVT